VKCFEEDVKSPTLGCILRFPMQKKDERYYAFGPYVVDPLKALLWRDNAIVPVARKTISVLIVLVEEHGEVVTKDDLFSRVWLDTFVEENTLSRHIATLRKILGTGPGGEPYIQTVTGRGYRFVADVRVCDTLTATHGQCEVDASPAPVHATETIAAVGAETTVARVVKDGRMRFGAALLAAAGVATLWVRTPIPQSVEKAPTLLTHDRGMQEDPTWSPDGSAVAYASDRDGNMNIWIQPAAGQVRRLTSATSRNWQPSWSPDGRTIAFRSERDGGGLYLADASSGSERRLVSFGFAPRWSADGLHLLFTTPGDMQRRLNRREIARYFVVDIATGTVKPVSTDILGGSRDPQAAWTPDGQVALWGRHPEKGWMFATVDVRTGATTPWSLPVSISRRLEDDSLALSGFEWSRTGPYLYFQGVQQGMHALWRVTIAPQSQRWVQGPVRLTSGAEVAGHLALSPDGSRIAYTVQSEQTRLWSFPFDPVAGRLTGTGTPVTSGGADEGDPTASVDGNRLVYSTVRGGRRDLWQLSLLDGRERLLLDDVQWQRSNPHASADGSRLVYMRIGQPSIGASVQPAVVVLSPDSGDERIVATPSSRRFGPTDWSPDGRSILGNCRGTDAERSAVCRLPLSSAPHAERDIRLVAADASRDLYAARFAPDQRWISFNAVDASESATSRIYVAPVDGGPWTAVSDAGAWDDKSRWAPDGRTVYYMSTKSGIPNVWGRRFDPVRGAPIGEAFEVTHFTTPRQVLAAQGVEIVVTHNRLVVPITETSSNIWVLDTTAR
jgi:Tol biopolymer transport system component/DNA-binding winged helix-turn-helix (wHTH) protein